MALFDRRTIIASLALGLGVLIMLGATSATYFHYTPPCNEAIASESISPDELWSAAVMERRCGPDELQVIVHINLRRVAEPVKTDYVSHRAEPGDVFAVAQNSTDPYPILEWNSPRELTIRCPGCPAKRVTMHQEHWGPITVHYQLSYPDAH